MSWYGPNPCDCDCESCPCNDYEDEWYGIICGIENNASSAVDASTAKFHDNLGASLRMWYYWDGVDWPTIFNDILFNFTSWNFLGTTNFGSVHNYSKLVTLPTVTVDFFRSFVGIGSSAGLYTPVPFTIEPKVEVIANDDCGTISGTRSRFIRANVTFQIVGTTPTGIIRPAAGVSLSIFTLGDSYASEHTYITPVWPIFGNGSVIEHPNCDVYRFEDAPTHTNDVTGWYRDNVFSQEFFISVNLGGGSPMRAILSKEDPTLACP
jgi:hypothetical protein